MIFKEIRNNGKAIAIAINSIEFKTRKGAEKSMKELINFPWNCYMHILEIDEDL